MVYTLDIIKILILGFYAAATSESMVESMLPYGGILNILRGIN